MSDPILKKAMNEIMEILEKHDIAGQVILVSKTHSEFRSKIDPTWSCAWFQDIDLPTPGQAVRFKLNKNDFPDLKEREEVGALTAHIFCQMRDLSGHSFMVCNSVVEELETELGLQHQPFAEFEPHKN